MGNTQKQGQTTNQHDLYGKANIFQVNGQKYHTVGFPVKQEQDGKNFINSCNSSQSFSKKHLLLSSNFTTEKAGLCGNSGILHCTFPFYPHSLDKQIQSRKNSNNYLRKAQLMSLVYQVVDGARNFDRIDEKVGDIRPSQILLDQSKRNIKLVNHFTSPNQLTGLEKAHQSNQKTLLAPQQLKALHKNMIKPQINVHKADAFSIGLTILSIGNLKKMEEQLYDFPNFTFSWTQLSIELQNFERRYGHFLAEIVKGFVQNEPRNRLYIGEVGALLQFYEKHIYQLLDFEPDYLLMQKSYEINYSGPKSQNFFIWLAACKNFQNPHNQYNNVRSETKVIFPHSQPVRQSKVVNSHIRFTYTSPSQIKLSQVHEN